jgi:hypothetical protein
MAQSIRQERAVSVLRVELRAHGAIKSTRISFEPPSCKVVDNSPITPRDEHEHKGPVDCPSSWSAVTGAELGGRGTCRTTPTSLLPHQLDAHTPPVKTLAPILIRSGLRSSSPNRTPERKLGRVDRTRWTRHVPAPISRAWTSKSAHVFDQLEASMVTHADRLAPNLVRQLESGQRPYGAP